MAIPKKFLDGIVESEDALYAGILTRQQSMEQAIKAMERRFIKLAGRVDVGPDGDILGPEWSLSQMQDMLEKMQAEYGKTYLRAVQAHVDGFEDLTKYVKENLSLLKVKPQFTEIDTAYIDAVKAVTFDQFDAFGEQAMSKISQSTVNSIAAGGPIDDLIDEITNALTGLVDKAGKPLSAYAGTYAQDSIMNTYRALQRGKAREAGLAHYLYAGNVIEQSRPFCISRAGKVFSEDEINAWSFLTWAGQSGDVWTCCGGYNCRHHLAPVDPSWIEGGKVDVGDYFAEQASGEGEGDQPSQSEKVVSAVKEAISQVIDDALSSTERKWYDEKVTKSEDEAFQSSDHYFLSKDGMKTLEEENLDYFGKSVSNWAKSILLEDETKAIRYYTGSGFGPLNKALREGKVEEDISALAKTIYSAIKKVPPPPPADDEDLVRFYKSTKPGPIDLLPSVEGEVNLRRLLSWDVPSEIKKGKEFIKSFVAGESFESSEFWSSTIKDRRLPSDPFSVNALEKGKEMALILEVRCKNKYAFIAPISKYAGEMEVLIPPGEKFIVVSKEEVSKNAWKIVLQGFE